MVDPNQPSDGESSHRESSRPARKAYGEFLLLQGTREEITIEEACLEHPSLAGELRSIHRRLNAPANPSGASASGPERISLEDSSSISSSTLRRILEAGPSSVRYVRKGEINRGGMGAILKVWDEDLRRTLAMKVVLDPRRPDQEYDEPRLTRFLEEAQITGQLDHPGVVPVHEVGMDSEGQVYFTMRLVRGRDLKEIFRLVHDGREGWNRTRALGVMLKVCEAMAFAHEKGVIHRDLKPANIMVGRFGETYVMDWGLAKVLGREDAHDLRLREVDVSLSMVHTDRGDSNRTSDSPLVTMDGDIVGTPCYMAPEQARGRLEEVGPASDVYSVGSMLYTLLTDRMPYVEPGDRMSPAAVLSLLMHGPPTPVAKLTRDVPGELIAICEKAMARDPKQRYASTMEMGEDLRAYLEDRVVAAYEAGSVAEFRKWISRNQGMAISIASAVVLALGGLGGIAWVQAAARDDLVVLNQDIEQARDQALNANAELGQANAALETASQRALDSERAALRNGYAANLSAAAASLRAMNTLEAQQRLERCPPDLRGWEWRRLALEADSSLRAIPLEGYKVSTIAFSPDGRRLAVGSGGAAELGRGAFDKTSNRPIQVIDVASGETVLTLAGHSGAHTGLAFTPDGARVVSGSYDRSLSVWDAHSGERLQHMRSTGGFVTDLSISPDGRRLAVSILKKKAFVVELADINGPRLELVGHASGVTAITFNHDGTRIATGSRDRTLRLWDAESGASLAVLQGHSEALVGIAFSPNGRLLASTCGEKSQFKGGAYTAGTGSELFLWEVRTQRRLRVLEGHSGRIRAIAFAPRTRTLASTSGDGSVRLWDLATGESELQLGHVASVGAVAFSPSGDLVASGSEDQTVRLWDPRVARGVDLDGHRSPVAGVAFWDADQHLVSASNDRTLRIWDATSGAELQTWPTALEEISDARLAPLAHEVVLVGSQGGLIWSTQDGAVRLDFEATGGGLSSVWIAPDASLLVVGCEDGSLRILDGATAEVLEVVEPPESEGRNRRAERVLATPDLTAIYFMHAERLYRWISGGGAPQPLFPGRTTDVTALAINARGTHLAVAHAGEGLTLIDAASGRVLSVLSESAREIKAIAFDPATTRLAVATTDRTVRLWDVITGEPLLRLRSPVGTVLSLAFDDANERLAAGFVDGRVHIWCTTPGTARHTARVRIDRARRMALPIVSALFDELVEPRQVIGRLEASNEITDDVRDAAIAMSRSVDGTVRRLESECLAALHSADEPPQVYQRALWRARLCVLRKPRDERYLRLYGMTLSRLGRHVEALEVLGRAAELRSEHRRARPEVLAFIALSQHSLGRSEESTRTLQQLRALMQISTVMGTEHALDYLREVEALIDPGT